MSRMRFPTLPNTVSVVLASGEDFADALVAAAIPDIDLLLVRKDSVPSVVAAELRRLKPDWLTVVGGVGAVTEATAQAALQISGATRLNRLAGADRYATAAAVARDFKFWAPETFGPTEIIIASGEDFPDALTAAQLSWGSNGEKALPVLLTRRDSIPKPLHDFLGFFPSWNLPDEVTIVGGPGAVSNAVMAEVKRMRPSGGVIRIGGVNRYATAALLARKKYGEAKKWDQLDGAHTFYATGDDFPDALAAAPATVGTGSTLLLTRQSCHPAWTAAATRDLKPVSMVAVGQADVVYSGDRTCT